MHSARFMDKAEKSTSALAAAACYETYVQPKGVLSEKVREISSRDSVIIPKKTKRGVKDVDIRPDIFSLEVSGDTLRAVLSAGGQRVLKPDLLANAMGVTFSRHVRLDIYKAVNGKLMPLFSMCES